MRIVVADNFSLERRSFTRRVQPPPHADFQLLHLLDDGATLPIDPNQKIELKHARADVLLVRLAPELLIETATRLGLARAGFELRFRQPLAPITDDARLHALLAAVLTEMNAEQAGWREMIVASIRQLAVHLLRAHLNVQRSDEVELSRVGVVDRRLRRALEFMHDNCARELKLAEMARAAYLSEFHFARLFKKITGATPHAHLAALRVERARRLLAETDLSLSEVGARVGYPSQSHFTRVFREATGLTPKAFRAAANVPGAR